MLMCYTQMNNQVLYHFYYGRTEKRQTGVSAGSRAKLEGWVNDREKLSSMKKKQIHRSRYTYWGWKKENGLND